MNEMDGTGKKERFLSSHSFHGVADEEGDVADEDAMSQMTTTTVTVMFSCADICASLYFQPVFPHLLVS